MEINKRIFMLLEQQGKTAKQLGEYIGVKPSSISAWKTEGSYPSSKYVIRISEFFSVSIGFLFTGEDDSNTLTDDEQELLNTYRELDRRGRHQIHTAIYDEIDRMQGIIPPSSTQSAGEQAFKKDH